MKVHQHFILHKPFGYLSQFIRTETVRKNKKLLGPLYDFPENTMCIGRLDEDSEGMLLLTTDGKMSHKVRSKSIEKEYYIELDGIISEEAVQKLTQGVVISIHGKEYKTLACKAKQIPNPNFPERTVKVRNHRPTSWASITISEGKFRQVRKMASAVGYPCLRLVRVRIGGLKLGSYCSGKVIEVDDEFEKVFQEV